MSREENKLIARSFIEEVFNRRDTSALGALSADITRTLTAFPDFRYIVDDMSAEGNMVVCRGSWSGTHTGGFEGLPLGSLKGTRIDVLRIDNRTVSQAWHTWGHWEHVQRPDDAQTVPVPLPTLVDEPVLDANEIQGNILAGFNKDYQTLLFLQIGETDAAKSWLRRLEPSIATLGEVLAFNRLFKALRARRGGEFGPGIQATWAHVAFSFQGLSKLSRDAHLFTDEAFKSGMHNRSQLLGDPVDPTAAGHRDNWIVGSPDRVPDIVLIIASDNPASLAEEIARLSPSVSDGLQILHIEQGQTPPAPFTNREHFGFRDGISQPGVRGRISDGPEGLLTPRLNPANPNQGAPGQQLVWPGEFVFGYPVQDRTDRVRPGPVAKAAPEWARNGSFLVFRRYRQDVEGFYNFVWNTAMDLVRMGFTDMTHEKLAAKLMGRWPSGAPIMRAPHEDSAEIADDPCADNHFRYINPTVPISGGPEQCDDNRFPQALGDDPGIICPHAAHIRKAYPRDDLARFGAEPAAEVHRLMRRGITFGPPTPGPGERGLLFLAYQTSFERQFEFIVRNWFNSPDFRDDGDGYEPILGQKREGADSERTFTLSLKNRDGQISQVPITLPMEWVTPTGGGYFFAPSISALQQLAR